jgi:hypothetical protein
MGTPIVKESLFEEAAPDPFTALLNVWEQAGGPSGPISGGLPGMGGFPGMGGLPGMGGMGGFGVPIVGMSDIIGGVGTRQALEGDAQTPRTLPEGAYIVREGIWEAPTESGLRVTFSAKTPDVSLGRMEGTYAGPSQPASGPAYVYVDRIAARPGDESGLLPFGRYTIPASDHTGYSDELDLVVWNAIDPTSVGLSKFSSPPAMAIGDKIPLVVRDLYANVVIAVTTLRAVDKDGVLTVVLDHPWKHQAFKDEGFGSPVFPRMLEQATITAPVSYVLDMSKM